MIVEVRIVVTLKGDTAWERAQATWDEGNVLCIGLDSGYNSYVCICKNYLALHLKSVDSVTYVISQ